MSSLVRSEGRGIPTGAVTFLFTDIEGSTRRWEANPEAMRLALRRHDALVRTALEGHGGYVFKTIGDAFCTAFQETASAVRGALEVQRALAREDWDAVGGLSVRIALHAGSVDERDGDYFGPPLNRVARLLSIAHGGQVILSGTAAELAAERLEPEASLLDLGSHRLKDLETPEKVYQLTVPDLRAAFPPLRSLDVRPHNLPQQPTSFIGRESELRELAQGLEKARLLTLLGPGGVGKTRLALQLGGELLERFPDGVWFVDLAPIADPTLVAAQTASVVGAPVAPGRPARDAVVAGLRYRKTLLIFDNCEHVAAATAELIDAILRNAAEVRAIATTRHALEFDGEVVFRVDSLALPPADARLDVQSALDHSAIALFVERGRAATGNFALTERNLGSVVEICRRLDGLALALELAAPKLSVLDPQQLAARLDQRFRLLSGGKRTSLPRQRTLRALIDWSYDLLDAREQGLFRRLSVFAGGWTLDAATAVCSDDRDEWDVFELLSALVAKSLVNTERHGEQQRFRMLESTRVYAREHLEQSGEGEEAAQRHAAFYAAYMQAQRPLLAAMDERAWQGAVLAELDNVRAAFEWTIVQNHDPHTGLAMLAEVQRQRLVAQADERTRWFELAAKAAQRIDDPPLVAAILRLYAGMLIGTGRPLALRTAAADAAVAASEAIGDPVALADALGLLASCLQSASRIDDAEERLRAAWSALESQDAPELKAKILTGWAANELYRGDLERARLRFNEALRMAGPKTLIYATILYALGELEFAAGNLEQARVSALEGKRCLLELHVPWDLALVNCNLAGYALALNDAEVARESLKEAMTVFHDVGDTANALGHCALLAGLTGDHLLAARLAGYSIVQFASLGIVREGTEQSGFERLDALLHEHLEHAMLQRVMDEGASMSHDEAVALASAVLRGENDGGNR
ncbi:MAG: adenylate/guanylate cyclase domain-containing protein [Candidatus Baltobacteraceae bacterium]|jgi:predicted ATPase/class 3 adenylate cyclase